MPSPLTIPFAQHAKGAASSPIASAPTGVPEGIREAWRFPLLDVQGSQVTLGSLVTALMLLAVGVSAARLVSRLLARMLARRTTAHPGAIAAARALLFYALCALVVLLALKVSQVPLSIFAVAGGALAIGVGFGSQNILNNFISGLILLIERPVREADIVQLDGPEQVSGVVRNIGARSTRIVTGENVELIVPNSTLLEKNILNWTLSNNEIRASIDVGVAYGTPLQNARDLLLEAAGEHGLVLNSPAPVVLCDEFDDSAIRLRMYFWMRIRRAFERRTVESDLRFKIEKLFRQHGVVIAFPQRDIYIRAAEPLRVLQAADQRPDPGGNDALCRPPAQMPP